MSGFIANPAGTAVYNTAHITAYSILQASDTEWCVMASFIQPGQPTSRVSPLFASEATARAAMYQLARPYDTNTLSG